MRNEKPANARMKPHEEAFRKENGYYDKGNSSSNTKYLLSGPACEMINLLPSREVTLLGKDVSEVEQLQTNETEERANFLHRLQGPHTNDRNLKSSNGSDNVPERIGVVQVRRVMAQQHQETSMQAENERG